MDFISRPSKKLNKHSKFFDKTKVLFPIKREKFKDPRNWKYCSVSGVTLPDSVDWRNELSSPRNQQELNACQSFAAVRAYEHLAKVKKNWDLDMSEMYEYYKTRELEGTTDYNVGAYIIDSVKALHKNPPCFDELMPYSLNISTKPSFPAELCSKFMKVYKIIKGYCEVENTPEALMNALSNHHCMEFGIILYESFYNIGSDGIMPTPVYGEKELGGHAMYLVGYDKVKQVFIVSNSWGEDWGEKGYCYIPFDVMTKFGFDHYMFI